MNIALLGNCQLEVIGNLLKSFTELENYNIVHCKPIYKINSEKEIVDIFHKLETCDFIFMQFQSEKWKNFSTKNLSKYFKINTRRFQN